MTRVRDFSITQKLTWMNMLVSGTALLLATGAFLGYARVVYRQTMVRYLTMRARVVGANCVSAVLFDDPKGAGDTLSALRADEHIVGAWVYTPQGEPFAGFWRDGGGSAPRMPAIAKGKPEAFWFANDQLMLIRAITFQGKLTAFVFFESDLNELRERQVRYLEIGALVLLASLLTAFLASRFFGQFVARPIRALFDTARAVSRDKDFSIRAAATDSHDEIEVLVRAFNEMLEQIQERDEAVRKSAANLAEKVQELARSNADLEQFAYIASHDLQEPLRTVASFAQLLQRRYKGKLDSNADEFIHYMVDGASRMQGLINDLLAFSRVGSRGKEFAPTDFATIVELALSNLQTAIAESHAEVTHDPLPTLKCDGAQLAQVFQNLVGNGIKFHNSQSPHVHIGAIRKDSEWVFSVKDNGIGIDPQFNQRIFEVFQRLHTRKEYPGSGIGLSITKKIVERHGGRIWVESRPGEGANFLFTLPA